MKVTSVLQRHRKSTIYTKVEVIKNVDSSFLQFYFLLKNEYAKTHEEFKGIFNVYMYHSIVYLVNEGRPIRITIKGVV